MFSLTTFIKSAVNSQTLAVRVIGSFVFLFVSMLSVSIWSFKIFRWLDWFNNRSHQCLHAWLCELFYSSRCIPVLTDGVSNASFKLVSILIGMRHIDNLKKNKTNDKI